jgi:hypothetical protein
MAHWLGDEIPFMDADKLYQFTAQLCKTMVDFKVSQWTDALNSKSVEISVPKKDARDTIGWLTGTVARSLARVIDESPNEDVWGMFLDALKSEMARRNMVFSEPLEEKGM